MKIAVWHNLPSGGGKRALYYHVRGLAQRGHQLECWSFDNVDLSYLPLSEFAPEHVVSSNRNTRRRRFIDRLSTHFSESLDRMLNFDEACRQSAKEIESGDFDVVFVNSSEYFAVPYIMKHLKMKKVLYLQEPNRFMYEAQPMLPWLVNTSDELEPDLFQPRQIISNYPLLQTLRLQAKKEWLNAHACDRLLVNSYFSRESILRSYGVDAKVCYLGIDTTLFRNLNLPRERFIVGLGSFDAIKGIDLAVKAVAQIPNSRPPLVWIANSGNPDYKNKIIDLARSLDVELHIKELISDQELIETLNRAALMLYTSRLEPFGLAPLEANACGLPVVAVAEGGIRETIQNGFNGFLVDPEPEAIAEAAQRILKDADLARRIGEQAAGYVRENWNLDGCVERLEKNLLDTVADRTQPLTSITKRTASFTNRANQINFDKKESESRENIASKTTPKAACTIIAKNYLAFARTLAQSFLLHNPGCDFYVLVIDDFEDYIVPSEERFEIISLADLDIPDLESFCFKYDVVELATATKPYLLDHLVREKNIEQVLYLDPDILVTAQLSPLYEKLENFDIVLTPHLDKDYPDDGLLPDSAYILKAGTYNLGFIGINSSKNAESFLNWWKSKLYNDCVIDTAAGYFVDQKFIDLVPGMFENIFIEKESGYNVAYWNLHSRQISKQNEKWLCNGKPLRFFHFSGWNLKSEVISKYFSPSLSRYNLFNRRDLQPLFEEYGKALTENGHQETSDWSYGFANFKTGELIPNQLRRQYRNNLNWRMDKNPFASNQLIAAAERLDLGEKSLVKRNTLIPAEEQLDNILNSRAWRLVSLGGSIKRSFLKMFDAFHGFFFRGK